MSLWLLQPITRVNGSGSGWILFFTLFFKDLKLRISQHLISSNLFLRYTFSF